MQLRIAFWTLLLAAVLLTLLAVPASAQLSGWSFGGAFNIGGAHFRVGFAEMGLHGPSYYFEVASPFAYGGYACSDRCYRRSNHYYHHPNCGVVNHHFRQHGYAPDHLIAYYGPPMPYPPPSYYGYYSQPPYRYYSQPGRRYNKHHHYRDKHYWKGRRHHVPPGQYKKHRGHHRDDH